MKRALVLGGGGPVGIAWETAILAGLLDDGVDVSGADLIVGTSAGSVVGTQLRHGRDPRELLREQAAPRNGGGPPAPQDPARIARVFQLWMSFDEMTPERCAEVGRLALATKTISEEEWIANFSRNSWPGWPSRPLMVTAVDCESGALRVFEATDGVPIALAVTASCSVPGMVPPVTIEGRRYTDGGVRSGTSADLAARIAPDVVLIIAPMGAREGGGSIFKRQIEAERTMLEAGGATVRVVMFDEAAKVAGVNLMDPAGIPGVAAAGEAHGRRLAAELGAWWRGGA
jgi:NTE family protein